MKPERLAFLDAMKCLGLALIVWGHVADASVKLLSPPVYPKQLGVTLFLFAAAFTLARETRPIAQVLFNRLFDITLFGLACALLVSAGALLGLPVVYAGRSPESAVYERLALSNYYPFLGGVNVAVNNFPANPTTWFIGTYFHYLLLWAVALRRIRVRPWMFPVALAVEILVRWLLMGAAGLYVAYQALPNWLGVVLLGQYCGQRFEEKPDPKWQPGPTLVLVLLAAAWPLLLRAWVGEKTEPFMGLTLGSGGAELLVRSACISTLYLLYTTTFYRALRTWPAWRGAAFIARNSLLVFILHMPAYYALRVAMYHYRISYWPSAGIFFAVCFVALAWLSEGVRAMVKPDRLRARLARRWFEPAAEQPRMYEVYPFR